MTLRLGADQVAEAARLLRAGELVAFPTETVYGLGADARNGRAVAAVFEAKGRPHFNPLICHFPDAEAAFTEVIADDRARALAAAFWPGPLTLVLPRRAECRIDLLAGAGLDTLAVRVPAHPLALEMLRAAAIPVAGPSANRSGAVSPTTADHVLEGLSGRIAAVLDGGACDVGVESTVLDVAMGGAGYAGGQGASASLGAGNAPRRGDSGGGAFGQSLWRGQPHHSGTRAGRVIRAHRRRFGWRGLRGWCGKHRAGCGNGRCRFAPPRWRAGGSD